MGRRSDARRLAAVSRAGRRSWWSGGAELRSRANRALPEIIGTRRSRRIRGFPDTGRASFHHAVEWRVLTGLG
jgi:hypothetical protein